MEINKNLVEKLITYSKDISSLYNRLYLLDINEKKDSKEYNDIISLIMFMKQKENEVYESIPFDELLNYKNYFHYLCEESPSFVKIKNKVLFENEDTNLLTRIINFITYRIEFYINARNNNFLNNFEEKDKKDAARLLIDMLKKDTFNEDLSVYSFISLDELLSITNDKKIINEFKKMKYYYSYELLQIETISLPNSFNINLDMTKIKKYKDQKTYNKAAYLTALNIIRTILLNDIDTTNLIMDLSILKTVLYLLTKDNITDIIYRMYQISDENPEIIKNRDKIITLIKDCLTT